MGLIVGGPSVKAGGGFSRGFKRGLDSCRNVSHNHASSALPRSRSRRQRVLAQVRLAGGALPRRKCWCAIFRNMACRRGRGGARRDAVVTDAAARRARIWGLVRWVDRNLVGIEFARDRLFAADQSGSSPARSGRMAAWGVFRATGSTSRH